MFRSRTAILLAVLAFGVLGGAGETQASTAPLFDLSSIDTSPFPSDQFTVPDPSQLTTVRVALPVPSGCGTNPFNSPSPRCHGLALLNQLDGFNVTPRISIPFSGPIDVNTVSSNTVFLVRIGGPREGLALPPPGSGSSLPTVGIDQTMWDPESNTLLLTPAQRLDASTIYLLVVTNGIKDPRGNALVRDPAFAASLEAPVRSGLPPSYVNQLSGFLRRWASPRDFANIIAASLFTTMDPTIGLLQMASIVRSNTVAPNPAFVQQTLDPGTVVNSGVYQTMVFPIVYSSPTAENPYISALTTILWSKQTTVAPPPIPAPSNSSCMVFPPQSVNSQSRPAVGWVAFGTYTSPTFVTSKVYTPPFPTFAGQPAMTGTHTVPFVLFVPLDSVNGGSEPVNGWPVAIWGHGTHESRFTACQDFVYLLNAKGIAVIAIPAVGYDGGPQSFITVQTPTVTGGSVSFLALGRMVDENGDGLYEDGEGLAGQGPYRMIGHRDGDRQTVVDMMQLVNAIKRGIRIPTVSGSGHTGPDLDATRIYYFGLSMGGGHGGLLTGADPDVRAAVLMSPATTQLTPPAPVGYLAFLAGLKASIYSPPPGMPAQEAMGISSPSLLNVPQPPAAGTGFDVNMPLRGQPILVNEVKGAAALQKWFDRLQWVQQPDNSQAYGPFFHAQGIPCPNPSCPPNRVLMEMAKGDESVPNPEQIGLVLAGHLESTTTFFLFDQYLTDNPNLEIRDPHCFEFFVDSLVGPAVRQQIVNFIASDGAVVSPRGTYYLQPLPAPPPTGTYWKSKLSLATCTVGMDPAQCDTPNPPPVACGP